MITPAIGLACLAFGSLGTVLAIVARSPLGEQIPGVGFVYADEARRLKHEKRFGQGNAKRDWLRSVAEKLSVHGGNK